MKQITLNMDFRDEDPADNGEAHFSYYDRQQPATLPPPGKRTRVNANYNNLLLEHNPNIAVVRGISDNPNPSSNNNHSNRFNKFNHDGTVTRTDAKTSDTGNLPDKTHNSPFAAVGQRVDRASNARSSQRARKLQLSDVDWYADSKTESSISSPYPPTNTNNDEVLNEAASASRSDENARPYPRGGRASRGRGLRGRGHGDGSTDRGDSAARTGGRGARR